MKWFKHDSKAHNDEKLREAIHEYGLEAYGVYWLIMELTAEKIDHRKDPQISISDRVLREKLRLSHQKVTKILSFFDQNSMIFSNFDGKNWQINCPNLLKRLDNWTSNLQVTDKQLSLEVRSKKENEEVRSENKNQIEVVDKLKTQKIKKEYFSKLEIELVENILIKDYFYPPGSVALAAEVTKLWYRSQDMENPIHHALEIINNGEIKKYTEIA